MEKALCAGAVVTAEGPLRAWRRRSQRFFAEGQANTLIVAGHTLANIAIRTLALHPTFPRTSILKDIGLKPAAFLPFSENRDAWASMNNR